MPKRLFVVALCAFAFLGCGTEAGRITLRDEGAGEVTVNLSSGQGVQLWTDLDASWTGQLAAAYAVELRDATNQVVGTTSCNPLDVSVKLSSVITNLGDKHSARYSGKMRCGLTAGAAGAYTIHGALTVSARPSQLTLNNISLVIKL